LDKSSRVPLYFQVMEKLIEKIQTKYKDHDRLPSERQLCDQYDVSRITIRQALQQLVQEGYIYKEHGKGTFVSPTAYTQPLKSLYSFTEEMKKLNKKPSTKVLSFKEVVVDEIWANKLQIPLFSEVLQIVRLRLADEEPLIYETSYIPRSYFLNLVKTDIMMRPMYDVFYEDYGINVTNATERFTATTIRDIEAPHLKVQSGDVGMLIRRIAYSGDTLIEYTMSIARGDKFAYTVELT